MTKDSDTAVSILNHVIKKNKNLLSLEIARKSEYAPFADVSRVDVCKPRLDIFSLGCKVAVDDISHVRDSVKS